MPSAEGTSQFTGMVLVSIKEEPLDCKEEPPDDTLASSEQVLPTEHAPSIKGQLALSTNTSIQRDALIVKDETVVKDEPVDANQGMINGGFDSDPTTSSSKFVYLPTLKDEADSFMYGQYSLPVPYFSLIDRPVQHDAVTIKDETVVKDESVDANQEMIRDGFNDGPTTSSSSFVYLPTFKGEVSFMYGTTLQKNKARDEKLRNKREQEKLRDGRMKSDPTKWQEYKMKQTKYERKKQNSQIKSVSQMTPEEHSLKRKQSQKNQQAHLARKKGVAAQDRFQTKNSQPRGIKGKPVPPTNSTTLQKNESRDDRLRNKREQEKLRYGRMKSDPSKWQEYQMKQTLNYQRKKQNSQIKSVSQMTPEERSLKRKQWRKQKQAHLARMKEGVAAQDRFQRTNSSPGGKKGEPLPHTNSKNVTEIQRVTSGGKKGEPVPRTSNNVSERNRVTSGLERENNKLKEKIVTLTRELETLTRELQMYKERYYRLMKSKQTANLQSKK